MNLVTIANSIDTAAEVWFDDFSQNYATCKLIFYSETLYNSCLT